MNQNNTLIIGLGVLALAGVGLYLYNQKRAQPRNATSGTVQGGGQTGATTAGTTPGSNTGSIFDDIKNIGNSAGTIYNAVENWF